jgi:hypothetical protein
VLSEQTSGAVGLLQQLGVGPDQMHVLFALILAATVAGTLVSAFTLNVEKLSKPIAIALALVAVGAALDSHATALTRPAQVYLSQALLGFASALFIGPALMIGITNVLQRGGAQNLVAFIVVFSVGQNVAGLAGSALVGTVETLREKYHSNQLSEAIGLGDPDVVLRLQQLSAAYSRQGGDAALHALQGQMLLQQQITQQAHVLAYNDVFLTISIAAAIGCAWVSAFYLHARLQARSRVTAATVEAAASAAD